MFSYSVSATENHGYLTEFRYWQCRCCVIS